jgi:hypothetical protein
MDLIRERVQQAVGRVAISVFRGGPAEFLYFLHDHFLVTDLPCQRWILWESVLAQRCVFLEKISSNLITGDYAQGTGDRLLSNPDVTERFLL